MTIPEGHRYEATQAFRQVLNRAVAWELLDYNPAKRGVPNPLRRSLEKRPFDSWAEIEVVATHLGPVYGPMIVFAAATGLRPAELFALEHRDLDFFPDGQVQAARACKDLQVAEAEVEVRPAGDEDRLPMAVVFAAVAEERDGIATEPPVDVEARAASWTLDGTFVAFVGTAIVGSVHVERSRHGYGEIGMAVGREWRRRGVGSALMVAAIEWARERGLHKLGLSVWPHNAAAIALYRKYDFVEEGRRVKQIRRQSGELWDVLDMGLLL
jgi:ribosomal protein S18 acetylase RimI-like enzyme